MRLGIWCYRLSWENGDFGQEKVIWFWKLGVGVCGFREVLLKTMSRLVLAWGNSISWEMCGGFEVLGRVLLVGWGCGKFCGFCGKVGGEENVLRRVDLRIYVPW